MNPIVKIAFVGDITPGGLFNYQGGISDEVISFLKSFDLRIGTLESAFGDGSTFCHIKMENFKSPTIIYSKDKAIKMLQDMHIDAVSLANNHSCDCDLDGLAHTIELLDKAGIAHFGAGRNVEECYAPAVLHHNGKSICLLGYLQEYHYLYKGMAYKPTDMQGGINIFSIDRVIHEIKKYKKLYDYVFVLPHWGVELSSVPSYEESRDARRMIEAGADGVVGSHAHIVQPMVVYCNRTIAMNLGNFAFPDRYIIPPRIQYYPNQDELSHEIPKVYRLQDVDQLSLKVVAKKERLGAILSIEISDNKQRSKLHYTKLSETNTVEFVQAPLLHSFKHLILNWLIGKDVKHIHKVVCFAAKIRHRLPLYLKEKVYRF